MTLRTMVTCVAVLALAACTKPPLDEQQRRALADSLEEYVAGPFVATFEHPDADSIIALYAPGPDVLEANNGAVLPSRDSIEAAARAMWGRPGISAHFTLGSQRVAVLDRDAAVYNAMVTGGVRDSAGVETPMRFAWTGVFVRIGGQWRLQAEHSSFPPPPAPAEPTRPRR